MVDKTSRPTSGCINGSTSVTLVGQIHIYIENHQGLLVFSDKEVRLLLKHGQLLIKGQSFVIKTILPEELLLEGIIEQVTFLENEKKVIEVKLPFVSFSSLSCKSSVDRD